MLVNYTLTNTAVPVSPAALEPVLDEYIPTTVTAQVCHSHDSVVRFAGKLIDISGYRLCLPGFRRLV